MGKPLHSVYAYLAGRKRLDIKIDKVITHRKIIPVVNEAPWKQYIITGGKI